MEVESVILLGLKMGICSVCIRGWGVGGVWRDCFGVFFFLLFVFGLFSPLLLWLRNHFRIERATAPCVHGLSI